MLPEPRENPLEGLLGLAVSLLEVQGEQEGYFLVTSRRLLEPRLIWERSGMQVCLLSAARNYLLTRL